MLFNLTSEHLEMCLISKRILNSSADKGHKVLFGKLCINRTKVSWNQCWMFRLFTEAFRVSFLSFFCSTFRLYIFSRLHLQKKSDFCQGLACAACCWPSRPQKSLSNEGHVSTQIKTRNKERKCAEIKESLSRLDFAHCTTIVRRFFLLSDLMRENLLTNCNL